MDSEKQNIIWQLVAQMALLLVLYATASLMVSLKFLANDPLAVALPYNQISAFQHILFDLVILTGLLAAATNYVVHESSGLLKWAFRGWTLFLALSVLAGLSGILEGRHMLELPTMLDIFLVVLLILWLIVIWLGRQQSDAKIVFLISLVVIIVAFTLSFIPSSNPAQDRLLRVLMVNMRFFIGYTLGGLAVISWLRGNESDAFFSAGILLLVGTILSVIPLNAIGVINFPAIIVFPVVVSGTLLITYRNIIQGQRWINFALLLWLVAMGVLGAILAMPSIGQFAVGTHLSNLLFSTVGWAVIAIVFGAVSRWLEGTRIYSNINAISWSFKLIVAGLLGLHFLLLIIGVVQVYMERIASIGYLDTQSALIPLYILWIIANLIWAVGIAWYANRYLGSGQHLVDVS